MHFSHLWNDGIPEAGPGEVARVIGSGRTGHRETVLRLGVDEFVDLEQDQFEDVGPVDMVLDLIGGEILDRSCRSRRRGAEVT